MRRKTRTNKRKKKNRTSCSFNLSSQEISRESWSVAQLRRLWLIAMSIIWRCTINSRAPRLLSKRPILRACLAPNSIALGPSIRLQPRQIWSTFSRSMMKRLKSRGNWRGSSRELGRNSVGRAVRPKVHFCTSKNARLTWSENRTSSDSQSWPKTVNQTNRSLSKAT